MENLKWSLNQSALRDFDEDSELHEAQESNAARSSKEHAKKGDRPTRLLAAAHLQPHSVTRSAPLPLKLTTSPSSLSRSSFPSHGIGQDGPHDSAGPLNPKRTEP